MLPLRHTCACTFVHVYARACVHMQWGAAVVQWYRAAVVLARRQTLYSPLLLPPALQVGVNPDLESLEGLGEQATIEGQPRHACPLLKPLRHSSHSPCDITTAVRKRVTG
jgi:hypothetical protein